MKNRPQIGYSCHINDPAFDLYLRNKKRYAWIFSVLLAAAAVVGFFIYGETSRDMDNPQALYIGLLIGGMFIMIAFAANLSMKGRNTWDGTVCEKTVEKKTRLRKTDDPDTRRQEYLLYKVVVKSDQGRRFEITAENDDTLYHYYEVGDKVRYHGKLGTYEKYDKSKDAIIFCNACASLNEMADERCLRCNCPLLK